jgi:predicted phage terminase large subunit-like protein
VCRACTRTDAVSEIGLETKVEQHRQEKILREELKKIARARVTARRDRRKRAEKQKAIEKFIPKVESDVEVDAATKELAQRVLQRRRLIEFVKGFHPKYIAGWVHHDICRKLEQFSADVANGKSPRLMILMPPRHGKSQIASKLFPAWHLGHNAMHEIIACSYNLSLAMDFSREVRSVLRSERYASLFPATQLDPESQATEAWKILSPTGVGGGGYVAAGIGGPINGKGAHVLIIDDPIKNAEEAGSPDHLKKLMDWYDSTAYTRLAPGGGVLVIMTWWSDNDPAGMLQERMRADPEADQFEVVKYPAIAVEDEEFRAKGDALHPERYPIAALERIKRTQGGDKGHYWNALYQQNPIPDEGAFFTKTMLKTREERPHLPNCNIYQAWDFAIGEKRTNDWTVGVTIAVDYSDTAHIIEVVRFKSADQLRIADEMLDAFVRQPRVLLLGVEDGQIWRGVKTHLAKRMAERQLYPSIEELRPLTDKTVRARPLQGRMQQQKVTFPKEADWLADARKELLRFPAGMHDDIVDALAWCMTMILGKAPPRRPEPERKKGEKTVAEKIRARGGLGTAGKPMAA